MSKKIIYFDLFGVLCTPAYYTLIHEILPESIRGSFVEKLTDLDRGVLSEDDLCRQLAAAAEPEISIDELGQRVRAKYELNAELLDFVRRIDRAKVRVGLLTNNARVITTYVLRDHLDMFDPVVISSDHGVVKPELEIYQIAAEKCQSEASAIYFVDDSQKNIEAAEAAGWNGIVHRDNAETLEYLLAAIDSR